jgi:hypothetical protein
MIAEARSQYWPAITAGPSWSRSRSSGNLSNFIANHQVGKTSSLWSAPIDVTWTPDLWGKIRNEVREAQYAAQVSAADLELEKLTEQASLAEYYFEIRGQDMLQQILEQDGRRRPEGAGCQRRVRTMPAPAIYISVVEARTTLQAAQSAAINVGCCARSTSTPSLCCWARSLPTFPFP